MPFASKGIKTVFLCTIHHLSLSNHPEPCCLSLYFSIRAYIKVVLWLKSLKGKVSFALVNYRSAIPSRDVRYLWLKEEVLRLSRHYQLLSWAKPWFPIKAASLTWQWFWKFHFSWKCSKMVLYLWFAENQHYKFGKKSLLLSCLRFTVSGRSLQLGCWARCSQHTAIAWGNMEAGNLCKRRKGSRCRPALSLMSMPYTSWLNSTSPRSL